MLGRLLVFAVVLLLRAGNVLGTSSLGGFAMSEGLSRVVDDVVLLLLESVAIGASPPGIDGVCTHCSAAGKGASKVGCVL